MKTGAQLIAEAKARIKEVTVRDVMEMQERGEPITLLDVRDLQEVNLGKIPGTLHISRGNLETKVEALIPRDADQSPPTRGKPKRFRRRGGHGRINPRLRGGNRVRPEILGLHFGSIPAYAGETPSLRTTASIGMDQSPPTRGKPLRRDHAARVRGSIPAYAGETLCSLSSWSCVRINPRLRGGNES